MMSHVRQKSRTEERDGVNARNGPLPSRGKRKRKNEVVVQNSVNTKGGASVEVAVMDGDGDMTAGTGENNVDVT